MFAVDEVDQVHRLRRTGVTPGRRRRCRAAVAKLTRGVFTSGGPVGRAARRRAAVPGAPGARAMTGRPGCSSCSARRCGRRRRRSLAGCSTLEADPSNPQRIEPLMRAAHSIKGAAGSSASSRRAAGPRHGGRARRGPARQDSPHPGRHRRAVEGGRRTREPGRPHPRHGGAAWEPRTRPRSRELEPAFVGDGQRDSGDGDRLPPSAPVGGCGSAAYRRPTTSAVRHPAAPAVRAGRDPAGPAAAAAPSTRCSTCSARSCAPTCSSLATAGDADGRVAGRPEADPRRGADREVPAGRARRPSRWRGTSVRGPARAAARAAPAAIGWLLGSAVATLWRGAIATDDETFPDVAERHRRDARRNRGRVRAGATGHRQPPRAVHRTRSRSARSRAGVVPPTRRSRAVEHATRRPRPSSASPPEPQPPDGPGRRVARAGALAAAVRHGAA